MKHVFTAALVILAGWSCLSPRAEPPEETARVPALPAFEKDARILFQGDSITDGNRGRNQDPNHILGHGYAFIIAAKYGAAAPELNLTFLNRGVSGNTINDLAKRWQKETLDLKPTLLSVLVGINDTSRDLPLEQFEKEYDRLLTDAKENNPKLRLVLGEPFTLPSGPKKDGFEKWQASVKQRQEVVAKLSKKHGAALVRYQKVFDDACRRAPADYWIWDGVHPTYSGHQLMADEWVRTVKEFWPPPAK
jgi:lysophospholipase L1-like esterase